MTVESPEADLIEAATSLGGCLKPSHWQQLKPSIDALGTYLRAGGCPISQRSFLKELSRNMTRLLKGPPIPLSGHTKDEMLACAPTIRRIAERVHDEAFAVRGGALKAFRHPKAGSTVRAYGLASEAEMAMTEFTFLLTTNEKAFFDGITENDRASGWTSRSRSFEEISSGGISDSLIRRCYVDIEVGMIRVALQPLLDMLGGEFLGASVGEVDFDLNDGIRIRPWFVVGDDTLRVTLVRTRPKGHARGIQSTYEIEETRTGRGLRLDGLEDLRRHVAGRLSRSEDTPAYEVWGALHDGFGLDVLTHAIMDIDRILTMRRNGTPIVDGSSLRLVAERAERAGVASSFVAYTYDDVRVGVEAGYAFGQRRGMNIMDRKAP